MRYHLLLMGVTYLAITGTLVTAAPPIDSAAHHDAKSLPAENDSDEEVRQLLDLKGLTAQRDLGNLKRQAATPAPGASSPSAPADVNKDQEAKFGSETDKAKETSSGDNSKAEKIVPAGVETAHHLHVDIGQQTDEDHHLQLKRQKISKPRTRFTPLDLALYVYKTGDEEGVTLAIQELIAEGLMNAEEALNYLREIRENLHYLNQQDEQEQEDEMNGNGLKSLIKKNSLPLPLTEMTLADPETLLTPDVDYDNLLEHLRSQDEVSTEFSLEEVIYQLAKILFKQAMHREGDVGSEKALQEVAVLLEKEVARGAITPEVEKKVLDVMVNSLVDSISENEFPGGPGPMIGGAGLKLPNNPSPFAMGNSPLKASDLLHLEKTTRKREVSKSLEKITGENN